MFIILVKDNSKYNIIGFAEDKKEVKNIINKNNLQDKINDGKLYLIDGTINLIRPETTPELLDIKNVKNKSDLYY